MKRSPYKPRQRAVRVTNSQNLLRVCQPKYVDTSLSLQKPLREAFLWTGDKLWTKSKAEMHVSP